MHQSLDGFMGAVADRVGQFLGRRRQFGGVGNELPGDRIGGIGGIDQVGHRRGDRDGIARRDTLQSGEPVRRDEIPRNQFGGMAQRSHAFVRCRRTKRAQIVHGVFSAPGGDHRRPLHEIDGGRAGRQHDEAVEAEGDAARFGHPCERGEKILVDRIAFAVNALLLVHLGDKAPALLVRVGQFGEAIGKLDAAGIELEALGDAPVARLLPR